MRATRFRSRATGILTDDASGYEGYVLKFNVRTEFLSKYDVHVAGSSVHGEYWVPAGDLDELNRNIDGMIEVDGEFRRVG